MSDTTNANHSHDIPQPEDVSKKERDDAMGAYFMTFATIGFGLPLPLLSLIASIIYHFVNAPKSRFVAFHSLQALLSEIPIALLNAAVVVWGIVIMVQGSESNFEGMHLAPFWTLLIFTVIATFVYIIISLYAAFRAKKGHFIYFWVVGPFAYRHYFILGKGAQKKEERRNLPPKGF